MAVKQPGKWLPAPGKPMMGKAVKAKKHRRGYSIDKG